MPLKVTCDSRSTGRSQGETGAGRNELVNERIDKGNTQGRKEGIERNEGREEDEIL